MPCLNEADIVAWAIRHLLAQGVAVHVLDGWSTDGSWGIVQDPRVTWERFPEAGDAREQVCSAILARIEDLAVASEADWIYYSDADEIRRSSRAGETLAEGIARIDAQGFNVIDHKVYAFSPTDDGYHGDPEQYLRYCTAWDEMLCRIPQQKCWKNVGRVNLTDSGGHVVSFHGKKLAPEKFILKHYPYRTQAQARERIRTRLERRCQEEHRKGWGVHYDGLSAESNFLRDPTIGTLTFWRDVEQPAP